MFFCEKQVLVVNGVPFVRDNRRGSRLVEHKHKRKHKHKVCMQLLLRTGINMLELKMSSWSGVVRVGDRVIIEANTVIEDSIVGDMCKLGPFARIRGGTELMGQSELGNFVEANRSKIGKSSKAKHLTYLGDSNLGTKVNVGAGTITCNYDGKNKHKTKLDDGALIGSNSSLVAPVKVGKGAYTGAGSVITKNVPAENLAIGRSKQSNIKRKK